MHQLNLLRPMANLTLYNIESTILQYYEPIVLNMHYPNIITRSLDNKDAFDNICCLSLTVHDVQRPQNVHIANPPISAKLLPEYLKYCPKYCNYIVLQYTLPS